MPTPSPEQPEYDDSIFADVPAYTPRPAALWQLDWPALGFAYSGVYIISPPSGWPIKIGISCVVQKRLTALQTSHWSRLQVCHYWLCENAKAAKTVEKAAHDLLKSDGRQMNGEWFDVRELQAPKIIQFIAHKHGIELVQELPKTAKFQAAHDRLGELESLDIERCNAFHAREAEKQQKHRGPSNSMALPYVISRVVGG